MLDKDAAKNLLRDVSEQRLEEAAAYWARGLRGCAYYFICERPRYDVGCGACERCQALRVLMTS